MFLHQKIFKTALKSDIKQWSRRRRRRHRCSESKVEKKMKDVKGNC
jgi:hypothetical protein